MSTQPSPSAARGPGAARSEKSRLAILRAASDLIATGGYEHLTIEGIAARAGVGKPTIYRWWSSKSELIIECLVDATLMPQSFHPNTTDDLLADITSWLLTVMRFVHEEQNANLIRSLIAAAVEQPGIAAELSKKLGATPESLDGRLRAAVVSGQLAADTPVSSISELLIGAVILRVISARPFEESEASVFVRAALAGSLQNSPGSVPA